jgi:uncharacterized protein
MKRLIDHFLLQWKHSDWRQPLLLRGARQVGKTYSVRQLGATYSNFVEINLEDESEAATIFEGDFDPIKICTKLSSISGQPIIPGKTLLFLDEIQAVPRAITALRYFYEKMPELHVIAAGSLIDFAIHQVGVPVGRIQFMYMYPLSFIEFLMATGHTMLTQDIIKHSPEEEFFGGAHNKLLELLGIYLAFGGMPAVLYRWTQTNDPIGCAEVHNHLLAAYRQDFEKYARTKQVKYVELVFRHVPIQLGRKFKYSAVDGDYRKRELAPALDLLATAGVVHRVYHSAGQGIPLGAQINPQDYKFIFLDVGLAQAELKLNIAQWLLNPEKEIVNKGSLVEAFVGQELLAYSQLTNNEELFYWHKEASSPAEIDYLIQINYKVVPVEVKAGLGRTLKSMQTFLASHAKSTYGIRFSSQNYSVHNNIHSYPLYAIAKVMSDDNPNIRGAINKLMEK